MHDETEVVEALLSETNEALAMQSAGFGLSQEGLPELRAIHARLKTGSQLGASELLDIRKMLLLARRGRSQLSSLAPGEFPRLIKFAPLLNSQTPLVEAIDDVFDENGTIRDDASSLLKQLRREVARLTSQTRDELQRIISSSTASKALQEQLFTQRNGRYVLPVQANLRSSIQGIVHDSSASGMTVYVEPFTVVELTNKARLKESEIEREIDRLLSELSAKVREKADELDETYRVLVEVDFIAARARLAQKYRGIKPTLSKDGTMSLLQARHPLLILQNLANLANVIANDIILDGEIRTLVITGPNTGGKTVFLKTAGLMALMVRAGLLLPVQNGSSTIIFDQVFADIGDEQSIEQNLSTFSSHMTNIVEIINRSGSTTLALLDEVGAGTDPREGAVLARVVLEHLNSYGVYTISTTHYGELKSLAYTTQGFINGSFEFDDVSLSPTYRMRRGVPGSSKAVTIASRLGLRADLVQSANDFLSAESTDIQQTIEELERRLTEVDQVEQRLRNEAVENEALKAKLEKRETELEQQREKLRAGLATRMEEELRVAHELIKSLISDLQKQPSISKAQKLQKDLDVIRDELGWLEPEQFAEEQSKFRIGQTVRVKSLNQNAVIESLPEEGRTGTEALASVRAGSIKIKVPISDLQMQPAGHGNQGQQKGARLKYKSTATPAAHTSRVSASPAELEVFVRTSSNTLDLRGQRVDAALANVERFVDSNFRDHTSPLMIIHGHGTGQLKAAVRRFLQDSPYGITFRPGENYEGGDGVTVVQFK